MSVGVVRVYHSPMRMEMRQHGERNVDDFLLWNADEIVKHAPTPLHCNP